MYTKRLHAVALMATAATLMLSACSIDDSTDAGGETDSDGSWAVDTDNCLDPEAATQVIGDTIELGWSVPLSGPIAATQVRVNRGLQARVDAYNASEKSIGDRSIDFQMKDDAYDPQRAKQNVTEFIQKDGMDILGTAGTGQLAAVADDQNEACTPLLSAQVAAPDFRDADVYPWTTSYLPLSSLEMGLITQLIENEVDDPSVGVIYAQSESGENYRKSFIQAAEDAGIPVAAEVPLTTPADAASAARESGANIVFNASVGPDCLSVPEAVARAGFDPEMLIQVSACADAASIYAAGGESTDGAILMSWTKQAGSEGLESDEDWQTYSEAVEEVGGDPADSYTVLGWTMMDIIIHAMLDAEDSEDGLTRASIMNAARTQDYPPALFLDGINWSMDPETSLGIPALQPMSWNAGEGRFDPLGDVLTLSE